MTELELFKKCAALGMTPAGAAGCTANILNESNGRPDNVENTCPLSDEEYTRRVDNGSYTNFVNDRYGYGLCQWTYPTRKEALLNYAREQGVSISNADMQFRFLVQELKKSYASLWNILTTTSSAYTAGYEMCKQFERPRYVEESSVQRGNKAEEIYERCKSAGVSTVYYDRQKVIDWAYSQIGYHEKASNKDLDDFTANSGSNNWNKYAAYLDTLKGFYNGPKNIGPNGLWCDIFIDAGFAECYTRAGAQYLLCQPDNSAGAGCAFSASYFNAKGQFYKSGPEKGDQIFFGDSWQNVWHTGLVVEVTESRVVTIEGNTSDQVAKRSYDLNDPNIFGYGRPKWGTPGGSSETPQQPKYTYKVEFPLLVKGDKDSGEWGPVHTLQAVLIARGYSCGGKKKLFGGEEPDGEFGTATEKAVADFQRNRNLKDVDGEAGGETYTELFLR